MSASNEETLKTAREKLYKIENLRTFKNINYLWYDFYQEPNFEKVFEKVRGAKFKPNDVISIGFPRSGSHWVFEILNMVVHQKVEYREEMMFTRAFETMATSFERQIPNENKDHPNIYTVHLTLNLLSTDFFEKGVKVVYILRNPKDTILSCYYLFSLYKNSKIRVDMSWEEFFELELTGEAPYGSWFDHVLKTETFMMQHSTCPIFVMQFEKLKENPAEVIRELCEFLGKPTDLVDQIVEVTSFSTMKEGTKEKMSSFEKPYWLEGWNILSKGKVREWKNEFTVAQNERFNEHFEKVCGASELANRVREYIL